jgi:hypothetical protein
VTFFAAFLIPDAPLDQRKMMIRVEHHRIPVRRGVLNEIPRCQARSQPGISPRPKVG